MLRHRIRLLLAVALVLSVFAPVGGHADAAPYCDPANDTAPNCYLVMDDGVQIALSIKIPSVCTTSSPCPVIFEMSGYDGASADPRTGETLSGEFLDPFFEQCNDFFSDQCGSAPLREDSRQLTHVFEDDYVTIHASVRGSGCSGGEFDLFSTRSAQDGAQVVEWLNDGLPASGVRPAQPQPAWSNGSVGIMGHSYGGITGFMVAAQQPDGLVAVTVSGLIDDLYRGITYQGGVSNIGFPLLWTGGIRPFYDLGGGVLPGVLRPLFRPLTDPGGPAEPNAAQSAACAANVATHSRTVLNDPIVQGAAGDTDNTWWQARALMNVADDIDVPVHIVGAYQDEQTGPRGPAHLWELVRGVPKRLVLTNGDHGTNQGGDAMADRRDWMDHWMLGVDNGFGALADDETSVDVWLEYDGGSTSGVVSDTTFPLSTTDWQSFYLRAGNELELEDPPAGAEAADPYLSESQRQSWSYQAGYDAGPPFTTADGPDEATYSYTVPSGDPLVIAGPIMADLWIASATSDTELFVQVIDEWTDGSGTHRNYLQRGLLKASHRAIDLNKSDCVNGSNARVDCSTSGAVLYRPYRSHTNGTLVTPGEPVRYRIEVFPVGHVFRPGHQVIVKVMAPPLVDSYYAYVPKTPKGVNLVYHDADHPSFVQLPVVPAPSGLGAQPACGAQDAVRCVNDPNGP